MGYINDTLPQTINPHEWFKEKTSDDILIDGIVSGIMAAGIRGDEVTAMLIEALKSMDRKDLVPPCCR